MINPGRKTLNSLNKQFENKTEERLCRKNKVKSKVSNTEGFQYIPTTNAENVSNLQIKTSHI